MVWPGGLAALLALVLGSAAAAEDLQPAGQVEWRGNAAGFGGFSGLWLSPDGATAWVVGDKGVMAEARLLRRDGRLVGVETVAIGPLHDPDGAPVAGLQIDAEGLAPRPGGGVLVSFEADHRIWAYAAPGAPAEPLPPHPDFAGLQLNSGIEALAAAPDGTLYAIPERSGALDRPFPVYRLRAGVWDTPFAVPRRGDFLVTGADIGPDGRLYVVERNFSWLGGFATRLRRFTITEDALEDEETLLEPPRGQLDNAESVAVWRDDRGRLRVTMISDDNFNALQRTLLSEFVLPETGS
ncbi:MAG: esterase-like activity of phytase family protein [Pseudomonadota bacterium]